MAQALDALECRSRYRRGRDGWSRENCFNSLFAHPNRFGGCGRLQFALFLFLALLRFEFPLNPLALFLPLALERFQFIARRLQIRFDRLLDAPLEFQSLLIKSMRDKP